MSLTRWLAQLQVTNTYSGQGNGSSMYLLSKKAKSSLESLADIHLHCTGQNGNGHREMEVFSFSYSGDDKEEGSEVVH